MDKYIFFILLFFSGFLLPLSGQNLNLQEYIEELKKSQELENASWSVKVQNCKTGSVVAAFNPQLSLIPASVAKLVTTGIALNTLGENFRFTTYLMYDGNIEDGVLKGNLYIVGGGDPLLGSYRYKQTQPDSVFSNWKNALLKEGIQSIEGNITYDASIFDNELIPGSWTWEDMGNYYGCGAAGLSFHENMYHIYFASGAALQQSAKIASISPPISNISFENKVTTAASGTGDNVIIYGSPYNTNRLLTGTIPMGESNFGVRGSLPNPAHTCADMFRSFLQKEKIKVSGIVVNASNYSAIQRKNRKTIMEYNSYSLNNIIELTNKQSNNMYAECIYKYLGFNKYGTGTYDNAGKAVYDYLKSKSISTKGVSIKDGSGLSQYNLATTDFLCSFLTHMSQTSLFDSFFTSIAQIKRSGNVNKILQNVPASKNVKVKTGSMDGVRSYAGYMTNKKGEQLCFAIIINHYNSSSTEIRNIMDKLLLCIANE